MDFKFRNIFMALALVLAAAVSCQKEEGVQNPGEEDEKGVYDVNHIYKDRQVTYRGATVSIKFGASASWTAELELKTTPDKEWASINANTLKGEAKDECTVRIAFKSNDTSSERVAALWLTVEGFEPECIATLTQAASGSAIDAEISAALNNYMHGILQKEYLWADEYNKLEVDLTLPYTEFLSRHLLAMGDVNAEDGGYYRATQPNAGERYIYSNIAEVVSLSTASTKVVEQAAVSSGLGFGPFISTALEEGSEIMGLAPSYVRRGSPAYAAGMQRGDIIYMVNGRMLTVSNYRNYMTSLYANPSGNYQFSFLRFNSETGGFDEMTSSSMTAGTYPYDPVLFATIINDSDNEASKIGYLVYESFHAYSQDFLEDIIADFAEAGITDLILDLRFNVGGDVSQSRWLSGCIAGESNADKTFTKAIYNDGKVENWVFSHGYSNDTDNLGRPNYLNLNKVYIIMSYNTASAAELVINSLKGVDFPVVLIGCKSEGKNVGMSVSQTSYKGRKFQFSPVTFYVRNAKDFGDYSDGFYPDTDMWVNNDNNNMADDADREFPYSFSDWGDINNNVALQWAYCDITGKERWDKWSKEHDTKSSAFRPVGIDFQPMIVPLDRGGSLVY